MKDLSWIACFFGKGSIGVFQLGMKRNRLSAEIGKSCDVSVRFGNTPQIWRYGRIECYFSDNRPNATLVGIQFSAWNHHLLNAKNHMLPSTSKFRSFPWSKLRYFLLHNGFEIETVPTLTFANQKSVNVKNVAIQDSCRGNVVLEREQRSLGFKVRTLKCELTNV
jgi:hypothetical protein